MGCGKAERGRDGKGPWHGKRARRGVRPCGGGRDGGAHGKVRSDWPHALPTVLTQLLPYPPPTSHLTQGYGSLLMAEAERIAAREHRSVKIAVISGVGTRHYYRKLGYHLEGPYMVKYLVPGPAGAGAGAEGKEGVKGGAGFVPREVVPAVRAARVRKEDGGEEGGKAGAGAGREEERQALAAAVPAPQLSMQPACRRRRTVARACRVAGQ